MRRRAVLTGMMVAVVIAAAAPAVATGSNGVWSQPVTVEECSHYCAGPWLASSPRNGPTLAWMEGARDTFFARRSHSDGTFGRRRTIADTFGHAGVAPAIAVGPSGALVAAWWDEGDQVIRARRMSPRGKLGRVHRVARPRLPRENDTVGELVATVDRAGNATIAWHRILWSEPEGEFEPIVMIKATVEARRLSAGGRLSRPIALPSRGGLSFWPRLAAGPSGRVTVAWHFISGCCALHTVRATTFNRGRVGKVSDISVPEQAPTELLHRGPELALDARSNASVVWMFGDILTRRLDAGGRPLGPVRLVASKYLPDGQSQPLVAVDRAGNATVVWFNLAGIQLRRVAVDGSLGPLQALSPPDHAGHSPGPQVAVDPAGSATVVWHRAIPAGEYMYDHAIHARRVGPDGALGTLQTLAFQSACRGCAGVSDPKVVADDRGTVTAAWRARSTKIASPIMWFRMARLAP